MIECDSEGISNPTRRRIVQIWHAMLEFVIAAVIFVLAIFSCLTIYYSDYSMEPVMVIMFAYTLIIGVLCVGWMICVSTRMVEIVFGFRFEDDMDPA